MSNILFSTKNTSQKRELECMTNIKFGRIHFHHKTPIKMANSSLKVESDRVKSIILGPFRPVTLGVTIFCTKSDFWCVNLQK